MVQAELNGSLWRALLKQAPKMERRHKRKNRGQAKWLSRHSMPRTNIKVETPKLLLTTILALYYEHMCALPPHSSFNKYFSDFEEFVLVQSFKIDTIAGA